MSILDLLLGGLANSGGSLTDTAKQVGKTGQLGILAQLGLGDSSSGNQMPWNEKPSSEINPAYSKLAELGKQTSAWGSGVAKASGPSRMPVSFGDALAGGQDALDAQQKTQDEHQLNQAKIGQAGQMDLEKVAQGALVKQNMGTPLTPQEQAALQAYDTLQQSKLTYSQDPSGQFIPHSAARSILQLGQGQAAQQPGGPQGGGQAPRAGLDPTQLRGYFQYLQQKAGQ